MNPRVLAGLALVALLAVPAQADPADTGLLFGASIGQGLVGIDSTSNLPDIDDEDFAWKLYAGYRFNNHFQVEGGYRDLGKIRDTSGATVIETQTAAFDVEALAMLKIAFIDLFVKGGGAYWDTEASVDATPFDDDGVSFLYGGGVNFRLRSLGIRIEYERINVDVPDDLEMISAGVSWTF